MEGDFLNRYTCLPVALDVLSQRRITLLSPQTWEDHNDTYYLERYKEEMGYKSVLAICFSYRRETFHHWRVFASGLAGVCIEFDKQKLLHAVDRGCYRCREVIYRLFKELKEEKPRIGSWPFLKRKPFKDEGEFRIIYRSKTDQSPFKHVAIDLSAIRKLTLSPWLSESAAESVVSVIHRIDGCESLEINPSKLLNHPDWRAAIG